VVTWLQAFGSDLGVRAAFGPGRPTRAEPLQQGRMPIPLWVESSSAHRATRREGRDSRAAVRALVGVLHGTSEAGSSEGVL
jgi:hypothetical protein